MKAVNGKVFQLFHSFPLSLVLPCDVYPRNPPPPLVPQNFIAQNRTPRGNQIHTMFVSLRSQSQRNKSYGKGWSSYCGDSLFGDADIDIPGIFCFIVLHVVELMQVHQTSTSVESVRHWSISAVLVLKFDLIRWLQVALFHVKLVNPLKLLHVWNQPTCLLALRVS